MSPRLSEEAGPRRLVLLTVCRFLQHDAEDAGADESAVLSSLVQHRLLDEEMLARALFLGPATAANPGSRPRTLVLGDAAKVVMAPSA